MNDGSLADALRDPVLRRCRVLAGDLSQSGPTSVQLVESLNDVGNLPAEGFAILGRTATASSLGYRLDITLREVAERHIAGLMLTGPSVPERVSATSVALARRAGVVLLAAPQETSLAELVVALNAAARGSAEEALRRIDAVLSALQQADSAVQVGDIDSLRNIAGEALGLPIEFLGGSPDDATQDGFPPVTVGGQTVLSVGSPLLGGHLGTAARIAVALTAAAIARSLEASVRAQEAPVRSRSAVLSELLVAAEHHTPGLVARAHHLGIPVDGWHRGILLHADLRGDAPSFDFTESLGQLALQSAGPGHHEWHIARSNGSIVLLQTWRRRPPTAARHNGGDTAERVVSTVETRFPQLTARAGVGSIHEGVSGLRATVAEARAALASQTKARIASADEAGIQTMLIEWYGTDTARQAVKDLLEPLERLGGDRATTAIETLRVYLDEQASLIRTGSRLHLHKNAVAYRMKRISGLIQADLNDPEQRLALQLACRARLFK